MPVSIVIGEHAVLVAGAVQHVDGHSHALGVVRGEDVAEVAGRHAYVKRRAGCELAVGDQLRVCGHVVHHLRQQTAPIDGIRAGKGDAVLGEQLLGEGRVAEHVLGARLAIVEVAAHAPHVDV